MANADYKEHLMASERARWNKVVTDFAAHLGAGGTNNHPLGNGSTAGFSMNDYTTAEKNKLKGIEDGANKYIHPATHSYTMITGLKQVSWTANYNDLTNRPVFPAAANGCDAGTVNGIRITIGPSGPSGPRSYKELWIDTTNKLVKVYVGSSWIPMCAVFA